MMSRFLLDEMIQTTVATGLQERGHDVRAIQGEPTLWGTPDEDVLELATADRRILVTRNVGDFVVLNRQWKQQHRSHTGIVFVPTSTFPEDRSAIGALVKSLAAASKVGTLPGPDSTGFLMRT